jgi:acetylornithine/N-succinyldiaminopimelate aminotransferase
VSRVASWTRARAFELAVHSGWEPLDLSLGVPAEASPEIARLSETSDRALAAAYPPSAGIPELRGAAVGYMRRRFDIDVPVVAVAACAGAKEFISTTPSLLRAARGARATGRDVGLIPALGYAPYEFGTRLAGLRVERVPTDGAHQVVLERIPHRLSARALYMWINSPGNPTGAVQCRMAEIVQWGRQHGVVILSDEAYAELTWKGTPRTALARGLDNVLAVHSMSKRSNAPGLRVGFYAGDPELVGELRRLRGEAGLTPAEGSQRTAVRLLTDDIHAAELQTRTAGRVVRRALCSPGRRDVPVGGDAWRRRR